jgi:hypothetical protein
VPGFHAPTPVRGGRPHRRPAIEPRRFPENRRAISNDIPNEDIGDTSSLEFSSDEQTVSSSNPLIKEIFAMGADVLQYDFEFPSGTIRMKFFTHESKYF